MIRTILLSLCLSGFTFADEIIESDSSEFMSVKRDDKTIAVTLGAGYESVMATLSASIGYFIDENMILDLRFSNDAPARSAFNEVRESIGKNSKYGDFGSISLGVKYFTDDTFYIKPALEYFDTAKSKGVTGDGELIRGTGVSFTVGNQWQYESFLIGVDWIGIKQMISIDREVNNPDRTHFTVAGFYVGTTF